MQIYDLPGPKAKAIIERDLLLSHLHMHVPIHL